MAATISRVRSRTSKYPWKRWTDGKARRAKKGIDFTCSPEGFRTTLAGHADRHGFRVTASINEDTVEFQFIKKKAKSAG